MTFKNAVKKCLKNYTKFNGRASRSEFWWFFLFCFLTCVLLSVTGGMIGGRFAASWLVLIFELFMIAPFAAAGCRRLHDIGRSGRWLLVTGGLLLFSIVCMLGSLFVDLYTGIAALGGLCFMAVFVIAVVLIVFWVLPGVPRANMYGVPPADEPVE